MSSTKCDRDKDFCNYNNFVGQKDIFIQIVNIESEVLDGQDDSQVFRGTGDLGEVDSQH